MSATGLYADVFARPAEMAVYGEEARALIKTAIDATG